jgi:hypothetical protein
MSSTTLVGKGTLFCARYSIIFMLDYVTEFPRYLFLQKAHMGEM